MRENPIETCPIPRETNPRRPWASVERYLKLRAVTDDVMMGKGKNERRSFLTEIFDLSNATGRRISAVLGLRYADLSLERTPDTLHGALTFRASHDKRQTRHVIAMNPTARATIDRVLAERPGIGDAPAFPAPQDPTKPMSADLADKWLRKAESLAGVTP
jgi:integrase